MSWKEFGFKKEVTSFCDSNYESSELIILLDKGLQITIQNYFFFLYSLKARQKVHLSRWIYPEPISIGSENASQTLKSFLIVSTLPITLDVCF